MTSPLQDNGKNTSALLCASDQQWSLLMIFEQILIGGLYVRQDIVVFVSVFSVELQFASKWDVKWHRRRNVLKSGGTRAITGPGLASASKLHLNRRFSFMCSNRCNGRFCYLVLYNAEISYDRTRLLDFFHPLHL